MIFHHLKGAVLHKRKEKNMKKILSLVIATTLLLSTLLLTSCDVKTLLGDFGFQTSKKSEETTLKETSQEELPRNTVTQEEWDANFNSPNFTFVYMFSGEDGVSVQNTCFVTENAMEIKTDGITIAYAILLNNQMQVITKSDETNEWVLDVNQDAEDRPTMRNLYFDYSYSDVAYNEETKSYTLQALIDSPQKGFTVDFYFENGKMIKGTIIGISNSGDLNYSYTLENIGTTQVTLPEYTLVGE